MKFTVIAGRYEPDGEQNIKFIDSVSIGGYVCDISLEPVLKMLDSVSDYPFVELELELGGKRFTLREIVEDSDSEIERQRDIDRLNDAAAELDEEQPDDRCEHGYYHETGDCPVCHKHP